MKRLVLVIALAAFSTCAFAEGSYQDEDELRLVRYINVYMGDHVTGGCLLNPNALKVEAELILRRSGITISDSADRGPGGYYQLSITASGFEHETCGCAANLDVERKRISFAPEGHAILITACEHGSLATGYTKSAMQETLRTSASEFVSDLANEILKA